MEVEDIDNIGDGEPLYANFAFEDWVLLGARFELHLLMHSYRKSLDDPDRVSFMEKDLGFYYKLHYKKDFTVKSFGVESIEEYIDLIKDSVEINKEGYMQAPLADSTTHNHFVKLTEDCRRARQTRVDAGDETARISFPSPAEMRMQPAKRNAGAGGGGAAPKKPRPPGFAGSRYGAAPYGAYG